MKPLLPYFSSVLMVLLSLTSCATYQYVTVESNLNNNDVGEYYIENDTVKIFFLFTGENGPVIIDVINKWDQPIFVNWKNSALIMNGTSYPLWSDIAQVQINTDGATDYIEGTYFEASSNGSITRKEHITFLPPQTSVINDQ